MLQKSAGITVVTGEARDMGERRDVDRLGLHLVLPVLRVAFGYSAGEFFC